MKPRVLGWLAGSVAAIDAGILVALLVLDVRTPPILDVAIVAVLALAVAVTTRIEIDRRASAKRSAAENLLNAADWIDTLADSLPPVPNREQVEAADAVSSAISRLLHRIEIARAIVLPEMTPTSLLDSRVTPMPRPAPLLSTLTRSGIFDGSSDPMASQEFDPEVGDMIGRLEPREFRWIESSLAEQIFLGWPLERLKQLSFLDVVHPNHRDLAREQLRAAIGKGEAHGLIYRIRTATGKDKAVEVNVGVRYSQSGIVDHLRCHVTDVTERLRSSQELRRRTRELLAANGQLIVANHQLSQLKDRFSDLYQNAPAMYFSLDEAGVIRECNDTLLTTLGYARSDLIDHAYVAILPEWRRPTFATYFATFLSTGRVELESQWIKASGEIIDVSITGTAVFGATGEILHSRSVAQDITARKILEAQILEKSDRLARAVEDLARKNQELDDFTYSVSHDLQEPLRTLTAFSTLLSEGLGDQLDVQGEEQLKYVLGAAKRMRSMIEDLLALSKSGKATAPFGLVNLNDLMDQVRADLAATIAVSNAIVTIANPLPDGWGDRDRIARLLTNLISNALKYSRPGAQPVVEISATGNPSGAVVISVKDNGIGIDPKYHERIFGLFRRLHARDEFEGTGAGLAICRKIVIAHGGTIAVESEVGSGAIFRVNLPGPNYSVR